MSAQIIPFPTTPATRARIAIAGGALEHAVQLPCRDTELELIGQMASRLLDQLDNEDALDNFLARIDLWTANAA